MPNKWMPEGWTEFLCEHLEAGTHPFGGTVYMGTNRVACLCVVCYHNNLSYSLEQIAQTAERISRHTVFVKAPVDSTNAVQPQPLWLNQQEIG